MKPMKWVFWVVMGALPFVMMVLKWDFLEAWFLVPAIPAAVIWASIAVEKMAESRSIYG